MRRELAAAQRELGAQVKIEIAEARLAWRNEAREVANLDEQLWRTEQRLGQRIDEISQAQRLVLCHRAASPGSAAKRVPADNSPGRVLGVRGSPSGHPSQNEDVMAHSLASRAGAASVSAVREDSTFLTVGDASFQRAHADLSVQTPQGAHLESTDERPGDEDAARLVARRSGIQVSRRLQRLQDDPAGLDPPMARITRSVSTGHLSRSIYLEDPPVSQAPISGRGLADRVTLAARRLAGAEMPAARQTPQQRRTRSTQRPSPPRPVLERDPLLERAPVWR